MAKRGACKTENLAKPKPWREQIIKELLLCYGNVAKACRIVDIATWTFYREKRDNAEFRKLVNEIDRELTGDIEAGAIKRAIKGVRKPIFYKGEKCGEVGLRSTHRWTVNFARDKTCSPRSQSMRLVSSSFITPKNVFEPSGW